MLSLHIMKARSREIVVSLLFFLSLSMVFCPKTLHAIWGLDIPLQKGKEVENEVLAKKMEALIPPGGIGLSCPYLLTEPRITNALELRIRLPFLMLKDPDESERIFRKYFHKVLEIVNSTPEIRPYLPRFPIDSHEIFFLIILGKGEDPKLPPLKPYISSAWCNHGKIQLGWDLPRENEHIHKDNLEVIRSIPAEEVFEKVATETLSKKGQKTERKIEGAKKFNDILGSQKTFDFGQKFSTKEGLIFIAYNGAIVEFTYMGRQKMCLQMVYCGQEKFLSLEEAKNLVRRACRDHLEFYQKDKDSQALITHLQKDQSLPEDGIARLDNMALRFTFWDKYIDRVQPPHIAEMRVYGKHAQYFVSDELQRLKLMYEEDLSPHEIDTTLQTELEKQQERPDPL